MKQNTQKKQIGGMIIRTLILCVLIAFLCVGYYHKFSWKHYSTIGNFHYLGVGAGEEKQLDAHVGDLLIFTPINDVSTLKVGDKIYFNYNNYICAGLVSQNMARSKTDTIEVKMIYQDVTLHVAQMHIIGKATQCVPVVGAFTAFVNSYVGIFVFSLAVLLFVAYMYVLRAKRTYSAEEVALLQEDLSNKRKKKLQNSLLSKVQYISLTDIETDALLGNSYKENKQALENFAIDPNNAMLVSQKYILLLHALHEKLIVKVQLKQIEVGYICRLIEMIELLDGIDENVRYQLVDLILKCDTLPLKATTFTRSAIQFLNKDLTKEDVYNFTLIFFAIITKPKSIALENIQKIMIHYHKQAINLNMLEDETFVKISKSIQNVVNTLSQTQISG